MFLHEIASSDSRFKSLKFHEGMNLLLADKTEESTAGDSRNGAGKSSFVRILRYLLGGDLHDGLKNPDLEDHTFRAVLESLAGATPRVVERPVKPTTRLKIDGSDFARGDWSQELAKSCFGIPEGVAEPTAGRLIGQLVRTWFNDATKIHPQEPLWQGSVRLGYFLGFSPEVLSKAGDVATLEAQKKGLNSAVKSGALKHLDLDEPDLRARLAEVKARRAKMEAALSGFKVDEQYSEHQAEADRLSAAIRDLNDEAVAAEERRRDLTLAMDEEALPMVETDLSGQLSAMYEEVGLVLPQSVSRRFDEVADFHTSVVRNRKRFLESELQAVTERLGAIKNERAALDTARASVMILLSESMALETFRSAEREVAELDAQAADLERRLESAQQVASLELRLKSATADAEASVRGEMAERETPLQQAIALYQELGEEIYTDRRVYLRVQPTSKGVLKVEPKIDGDASRGISEVKTFLLDIVCVVMAIQMNRAPRILVHDSELFDSMDDRQLASCLNIGARLADQHGFQYIVTINTDRLEAAEREGFERQAYPIDTKLTDRGATGGLFGFRFV